MIYFAGDFHLGAPDLASSRLRELRICNWLEAVASDAREIYLMGDVFDFWFEYKNTVPKGYTRLLGTLAKLVDSGIKVTTFKGNHDMWMFGYLKNEIGLEIVSDELTMERGGKKFFMHHGDGLGRGEYGYKVLRKIFRSKLCQWLFARIHPNTGIALASFLSHSSRISQKQRYETYLGDEKEILTQFCVQKLEQEHFDFFIFGHRHLALDIALPQGARYINTGEWVNQSPYAKFDGQTVHLLQWSAVN